LSHFQGGIKENISEAIFGNNNQITQLNQIFSPHFTTISHTTE